jgi:hypothetical protein
MRTVAHQIVKELEIGERNQVETVGLKNVVTERRIH